MQWITSLRSADFPPIWGRWRRIPPDTPGYPRIPHRKHTGYPCGTQQDPPGTTLALAQTDFHHQREAPKLKKKECFFERAIGLAGAAPQGRHRLHLTNQHRVCDVNGLRPGQDSKLPTRRFGGRANAEFQQKMPDNESDLRRPFVRGGGALGRRPRREQGRPSRGVAGRGDRPQKQTAALPPAERTGDHPEMAAPVGPPTHRRTGRASPIERARGSEK